MHRNTSNSKQLFLDLETLPRSALLTRKQVAHATGFAEVTLKRWASLGTGPRITRVEKLPRFKVSDVLDWMEGQNV